MKKFILSASFILAGLAFFILSDSISANNSTSVDDSAYFVFDSPKQIQLASSDADKIADTLVLEDNKGHTYDAVINIINSKTIAISPIDKIDNSVRIKGISNYKISDYKGDIYVQNQKNLKKISNSLKSGYTPSILYDAVEESSFKSATTSANIANSSAKASDDYSRTNIQTKGIDEADIVKTDGKNIYYVKENELIIVEANPKNPIILSRISSEQQISSSKNSSDISSGKISAPYYKDYEKNLNNVYIDNNKLSLIYSSYEYNEDYNYSNKVIVDTYDVSEPANPKLLYSKSVDGYLIESRKKGDIIYITSSDSFEVIYKDPVNIPFIARYRVPDYEYDSGDIDLTKMLYIAFNPSSQITSISSINTANNNSNSISYMGSSGDIYMSSNNIYITYPSYSYDMRSRIFNTNTLIQKFAVNNMNFKYIATNTINGETVNQFSLNESNGNLFVAYTKHFSLDDSENNLICFDKNMNKISELSGLAKGERIYSVRFMQDKAYIVTFKQVDPLFVIDIKNPKSMQVLGYLKIPGYSNYLHPYKDNYLIGFGQNTSVSGTAVLNDGFKISLFDVSDFSNPKELDVQSIGERGSFSEIEYDHKALMFDENRNIFSIPVYVRIADKKTSATSSSLITSFIGAYVYNISEDGFDLKGRITHYTPTESENIQFDVYQHNKQIRRCIQIDDNLYTLSNHGLKINNINNLEELSSLDF